MRQDSRPRLRLAVGTPADGCAPRWDDANFRQLFEDSPDAIVLLSEDDRVIEVNRSFERIFGYRCEEAVGRQINSLIVPDDSEPQASGLSRRVMRGEIVAAESTRRRKDGTPVDVRILGYPIFRDGRQIGIFGIYSDISMRRHVERILRLQAAAMDSAASAIFITSYDGAVEWVNRAFSELSGYSEDELLGRDASLLDAGRSLEGLDPRQWQRLPANELWRGQVVVRHKDGHLYTVEQTVKPLVDPAAGIDHFVVVQEDISERVEAERRLHHMARHDFLTALPNRYAFGERLERELDRAGGTGVVAVMILDLDHFKDINDSYGHAVGDDLLVAVGRRLRGRLPEGATLARFGGDEFGIVPSGLASFETASSLAQELLDAFTQPFAVRGQEIYVGASIGIAVHPPGPADARSLIKNADMALYRAKADGRSSFRFYEQQMDREVRRRMWLGQELRGALERDELSLAFQPQIDLDSGVVIGVEALLRWCHPGRGWIPPDRFIPAAEATGLIVPIGEWVLHQACAQAQRWRESLGIELRVGVNLSPVQVREPRLPETVANALQATGLDPALLELELTESLLVQASPTVEASIERLLALGVGFALDDFGKGYSSLDYLRRFRLRRLKIDRTFVAGLGNGSPDPVIVSLITVLGQKLGLEVIAEGVETRAQLDFLAAEGCRQVQGYYFSRPLPPADLEELLRAGNGRIAGLDGPRRLGGLA